MNKLERVIFCFQSSLNPFSYFPFSYNLTGTHALQTYCRKSGNTRCPLSNSVEDCSLAVFGNVMSDLKISKCTTSLGMYHSLWDPFSVKVAHLIQKLYILQQNGSPGSNCHGRCLCVNWTPSSSSENIWRLVKNTKDFSKS